MHKVEQFLISVSHICHPSFDTLALKSLCVHSKWIASGDFAALVALGMNAEQEKVFLMPTSQIQLYSCFLIPIHRFPQQLHSHPILISTLTAMLTFPSISSGTLFASFSTWSRDPPSCSEWIKIDISEPFQRKEARAPSPSLEWAKLWNHDDWYKQYRGTQIYNEKNHFFLELHAYLRRQTK